MTLAYHGDPAIKAKYLARVRAHREADELVAGTRWNSRKGCAVGCTFEKYDHSRGPIEIGVPSVLIWLEDAIFEGLARTTQEHREFPEAFLSAISPGANLSMVWPRFALTMLSDPESPVVKHAGRGAGVVARVAGLYRQWVETGIQPPTQDFVAASRACWAEVRDTEAKFDAPTTELAMRAATAAMRAAAAAAEVKSWLVDAARAAGWVAGEVAEAAAEADAAAWRWMRDRLLALLAEAK